MNKNFYSILKKSAIFSFLVFSLLLLPLTVLAGDYKTGNDVIIEKGITINDDLYISGNNVTVDGNVNGDVVAAGGKVRITGNVTGDVNVAGGEVTIEGNVSDDVRVGGGSVIIRGNIQDDVLTASGKIEIASGAIVNGQFNSYGGEILIAGQTGDVNSSVGNLSLASTSRVNGNLNYNSQQDARIENGAFITGQTKKTEPPVKAEGFIALAIAGAIISFFITLLMALLLKALFPRATAKLAFNWWNDFGWNLLLGFIFLVVAPALAIILMLTVIGIPLGIGILLALPIIFYIGHLVGIIGVGSVIEDLWKKEPERVTWIGIIIGVVLLTVISLIPFLGWLIVFLVFISGLGTLVQSIGFGYKNAKNRKEI